MLDVQLFCLDAGAHHVVNVVAHTARASLYHEQFARARCGGAASSR